MPATRPYGAAVVPQGYGASVSDWESDWHYSRGQVRVAWAADQIGLTHDQLRQEARDRGMSATGGIAWDDLLAITRELHVREGDDERRARLVRALKTFIVTRREAAERGPG